MPATTESTSALSSTEARTLKSLTSLASDLSLAIAKLKAKGVDDDSAAEQLADLLTSAEAYRDAMSEALLAGSGIGKVIGKIAKKGKGLPPSVVASAKKVRGLSCQQNQLAVS